MIKNHYAPDRAEALERFYELRRRQEAHERTVTRWTLAVMAVAVVGFLAWLGFR